MMKKPILVLIVLAAIIPVALSYEYTIVDEEGEAVNMSFDIKEMGNRSTSGVLENETRFDHLGSESFTDDSIVNPDASLRICEDGPDSEINELSDNLVQLFYTSYSGNLTQPLLSQEPQVQPHYINHDEGCAEVDIDISPFDAKYPGYLEAGNREIDGDYNETVPVEHKFHGNYTKVVHIDPRADDDEASFFIDVTGFSEEGHEISSGRDSAILSITREIDGTETSLSENYVNTYDTQAIEDISFRGGERLYINDMFTLETEIHDECTDISGREEYHLLNTSQQDQEEECVVASDLEQSTLDLGGNRISGDNNRSMEEYTCAVTIKDSENVTVMNPNIDRYDSGICIEDSEDITVVGAGDPEVSGIVEINQGMVVRNSTTVTGNLRIIDENNRIIESRENSTASLVDVRTQSFDGETKVSGEFRDADLRSVEEAPEPPEHPEEGNEYVPLNHYLNVTETSEDGEIRELGFRYGDIEENIEPVTLFQQRIEENEEDLENINLDTLIDAEDNFMYTEEHIDEFSIFGAFGEYVEADPNGDQDAPGVPDPDPTPEPTPDPGVPEDGEAPPGIFDVNLTLLEEEVTLEQGASGEIPFEIENLAENHPEDLVVQADVMQGWDTAPTYIDEMEPLETVEDSFLLEVYENEVVGSYTVEVAAMHAPTESTLDVELLEVEVELREELRAAEVLEAPTFIDMEAGETEEIGLLIENTGDYHLEDIDLSFRNAEECIVDVEGTGSVERGETENIFYEIEATGEAGECSAVMVLEDAGEVVGFNPVQINIEETDIPSVPDIPVMLIVLVLWTILTVYWMVFERG